MSTKDNSPKDDIVKRILPVHNDSMSLQWMDTKSDMVRAAGYGPTQQELYTEVAREMRRQEREELERMWGMSEKVSRVIRGPQWRVWITWFGVGFAGGTLAAVVAWIANNGW